MRASIIWIRVGSSYQLQGNTDLLSGPKRLTEKSVGLIAVFSIIERRHTRRIQAIDNGGMAVSSGVGKISLVPT